VQEHTRGEGKLSSSLGTLLISITVATASRELDGAADASTVLASAISSADFPPARAAEWNAPSGDGMEL